MNTCLNNLLKCPKCLSLDIWKHGFHYANGKEFQKYKCKKCGYVWVEKND